MAVPNVFAGATGSIPLSQLDANFNTAITLGNTAVYLGNTTTTFGNVTLTNPVLTDVNSLTGNGIGPGFKNRIINGAMVIDQRNAGASVSLSTGAAFFVTDRFSFSVSQNSKCTAQQNAGSVTPPSGFNKYLGFTVGASANVTVAAGDYFVLQHRIEGNNLTDTNFGASTAKTFTVSFWVRSSLTGSFGFALQNGGQTRSYATTYTINAANTWEYKTITVAGDTSGTWNTDNTAGMVLAWGLGVGSTYAIAAGSSWTTTTSPNGFGVTSTVQLIQTNSATFYITGVQLELGSAATSFDARPFGTELALCQRYCYTYLDGGGNDVVAVGQAFSTTSAGIPVYFKQSMRATPSTLTSSGSFYVWSSDGNAISVSSVALNSVSGTDVGWVDATTAGSLAAGNATGMYAASSGAKLIFSAEL